PTVVSWPWDSPYACSLLVIASRGLRDIRGLGLGLANLAGAITGGLGLRDGGEHDAVAFQDAAIVVAGREAEDVGGLAAMERSGHGHHLTSRSICERGKWSGSVRLVVVKALGNRAAGSTGRRFRCGRWC